MKNSRTRRLISVAAFTSTCALAQLLLHQPAAASLTPVSSRSTDSTLKRLLNPDDMPIINDSPFKWRVNGQGNGQGNRRLSYCTQQRFDQLESNTVAHRYFAWGPSGSRTKGSNVVGKFATERDARNALNAFLVEVDACDKRFNSSGAVPVPLGEHGFAHRWHVTIGEGVNSKWEFAAIVRIGHRISFINYELTGQDVPSLKRINRSIQKSVDRLT